jgi:methylglutaconyl-CoA hydratase
MLWRNECSALAQALAANSPESLAATKRLLAAQNKAWLDAAIARRWMRMRGPGTQRIFARGLRRFWRKESPCGQRSMIAATRPCR